MLYFLVAILYIYIYIFKMHSLLPMELSARYGAPQGALCWIGRSLEISLFLREFANQQRAPCGGESSISSGEHQREQRIHYIYIYIYIYIYVVEVQISF